MIITEQNLWVLFDLSNKLNLKFGIGFITHYLQAKQLNMPAPLFP
jgi:hypothetical protein